MVRYLVLTLLILMVAGPTIAPAEFYPPPQAPAKASWLPHGYGGNMHVHNTVCTRKKGLHGFRTSPEHIGEWSMPLWGWDVNGYYRGPNVPSPDPGMCQLPIGLIYPANGQMLPPPPTSRKVRAAHK
jgi:hypothetical protein